MQRVRLRIRMRDAMLSADAVLRMQKEQFQHDKRNHCDIASLHKGERLKHYGLHFCKYVGRLARGSDESKSVSRTLIDTALVSLSAANTLQQRLGECVAHIPSLSAQVDPLRPFADAAGRFADACEKFDHLEDVRTIARAANADVFVWVLAYAAEQGVDVVAGVNSRRLELADRAFYAQG